MSEPHILNKQKKSKGSVIVEVLLTGMALAFALSSTRSGANIIVIISGSLAFILLFCLWSLREELFTKNRF